MLAVRSFYLKRQTEEMLWSILPLMPIWCPAKFKPLGMGKHRPFLPSSPLHTEFKDAVRSSLGTQLARAEGPVLPSRSRDCCFPEGLRPASGGSGGWKIRSLGNRSLAGKKKRRIRAKFCCPSQKARLDGSLRLLNLFSRRQAGLQG